MLKHLNGLLCLQFKWNEWLLDYDQITLRKKCPYSELLWSAFSCIRAEYGEILRISPYSVQMPENAEKMAIRTTPNTNTFYAVSVKSTNLLSRKMVTESSFVLEIFPAKKKQRLPLQFDSGKEGFSPGGRTSLPLLKPRHYMLYFMPITWADFLFNIMIKEICEISFFL